MSLPGGDDVLPRHYLCPDPPQPLLDLALDFLGLLAAAVVGRVGAGEQGDAKAGVDGAGAGRLDTAL